MGRRACLSERPTLAPSSINERPPQRVAELTRSVTMVRTFLDVSEHIESIAPEPLPRGASLSCRALEASLRSLLSAPAEQPAEVEMLLERWQYCEEHHEALVAAAAVADFSTLSRLRRNPSRSQSVPSLSGMVESGEALLSTLSSPLSKARRLWSTTSMATLLDLHQGSSAPPSPDQPPLPQPLPQQPSSATRGSPRDRRLSRSVESTLEEVEEEELRAAVEAAEPTDAERAHLEGLRWVPADSLNAECLRVPLSAAECR